MAANTRIHVVVVTVPERLDQEWIGRLAAEPEIARVDRVAATTAGFELIQQTRPDLVIVDREPDQTEQLIRQVFTTLPVIICIAVTARVDTATLRRLVAVGARDVLARPIQYAELIQSIRTLLETESDRRSRALVTLDSNRPQVRGKLVVVISPKGGSGTTTIATNLAVGLRQVSASRVLLADCCLQFGDAGVHLNLWSKHTLVDLIDHLDDIDDAMISSVVQQHSSGTHVLLAPNTPDAAGDISGEQISRLLDALLTRYSYVVADTWSFLDDITATLVSKADETLVVTTPEVPSLKNVKRFLEFIQREGLTRGKITLVINRFPSVDGIALDDVKQHLRHPISANIPSEGRLVTHSVNRGIPIVMSHPESWVGQSLLKLAAHVAGEQVATLSLAPSRSRSRGLAGLIERRGFFGFARRET